uniref:Capsid protein n=1 Tax=Atrato Denso-like virus TaxID=2689332 RepID=A0A6B9KNS5_9VIRU|nr:hypothetical protein [Atrato Denso-like virus]
MAPVIPKWQIARTLQEGTQRKPFWAYKYNKNRIPANNQQTDKPTESEPRGQKRNIEETDKGTEGQANQSKKQTSQNNMSRNEETVAGGGSQPMDQDPEVGASSRVPRSIGTGLGGPKGAAAGLRGSVQWPDGEPYHRHVVDQTYTKNYWFRINSEGIKYKSTHTNGRNITSVKIPVYEFRIDKIAMYLSAEQISKILNECTDATVLECTVEIYNRTATLPFQINSTNSSLANNNVGVYIFQLREDINKYRVGNHTGYDSLISQRVWGKHLSELPVSADFSTMNLGELGAEFITKDWTHQFEFQSIHDMTSGLYTTENNIQYNENMFPYRNYCVNYRNATFEEGLYSKTTYKPQDGTIHNVSKNTDWMATYDSDGIVFNSGRQLPTSGRNGVYVNNTFQNRPLQNIKGVDQSNQGLDDYETFLHPSQRLAYTNYEMAAITIGRNNKTEDIPCVSIGIDPLYTGELANKQGEHVNAKVVIEARFKCVIRETRSTSYRHPWGGSLVQPDTKFPKFTKKINHLNPVPTTMQYQNSTNFVPPYSNIQVDTSMKTRQGPSIDLSYNNYSNNPRALNKIRHYLHRDGPKHNYNLRSKEVRVVEKDLKKHKRLKQHFSTTEYDEAKTENEDTTQSNIIQKIQGITPQADEPVVVETEAFRNLTLADQKSNKLQPNPLLYVSKIVNGKKTFIATTDPNPYYKG